MPNPNDFDALKLEILLGLKVVLSKFRGEKDAVEFAADTHMDGNGLSAKREEVKNSATTFMPEYINLDYIHSEVYVAAYVSTLTNIIRTLSGQDNILDYLMDRSKLSRKMAALDGTCNACIFALEAEGDLSTIKNELSWSENYIIESLAKKPDGRMSPAAQPRWERDGLNIGLRECIKEIERILAKNEQNID